MLSFIDELGNIHDIGRGWLIAVAVIVIAVIIGLYLLRSFGLYILAKRRGMDKLYFAFLPILWIYTASKLAGHVTFFGARIKKFALWATIIVGFSILLNLVYNILIYYPLIEHFLKGGNVYIPASLEKIPEWVQPYALDRTFYVSGFSGYPYPTTNGVATAFNVTMIVNYLFSILEILIMINVYLGIFKKYWTNHVFAGTILSVFGFFGIVIFAVRKHKEINFDEYMRSRMYYGSGMNNPNLYDEERERAERESRRARHDDPFAEFLSESEKPFEDPFSEFSSSGDSNGKETNGGDTDDKTEE